MKTRIERILSMRKRELITDNEAVQKLLDCPEVIAHIIDIEDHQFIVKLKVDDEIQTKMEVVRQTEHILKNNLHTLRRVS